MVTFKSVATAALAFSAVPCSAVNLEIKASGGNVSFPAFYGIMHEDINNSGDGGIYAELIANRAFQGNYQYPSNLSRWAPVNSATLTLKKLPTPLSSALPTSVNVAGTGKIGLVNSGYWGIEVKEQNYTGSFYVKGAYNGTFTASLQSALGDKEVFGSVEVASKSVTNEWVQHKFVLVPSKAAKNTNNTFSLTFDASAAEGGALDFNLISLFPPTYNNRPNGLRIDLVEAFKALNPKWLRLPGGNMLMGNKIDSWWKWNETIGDLKDRPGMAGTWEYQLTGGLGLVEYMEWADDLNLEVILGVWSGLSLDGDHLSREDIHLAVEHALEEMEFLTGDAKTTKWGAVRASLGHPKPWKVSYIEIGNEDWLAGRPTAYDAYKEYRLPVFVDAFREKYPKIPLIASPSIFDNITLPAGVAGDWHPYLTPDKLVLAFNRFDPLSRDNVTLIGEAAATHPNGGLGWDGPLSANPWWGGSVAEAIFLIGAERNSEKVIGACYAPGLRNLNRWQWGMTLVQHAADSALTTFSTSWHVWKLLGRDPIKKTLPVVGGGINPLFYVAGEGEKGASIWKAAVYNSTAPVPVSIKFEKKHKTATLTLQTGPEDPYGYNDPFTRVNVVKETKKDLKPNEEGVFEFSLPALSVAILKAEK
ncbi:glycoside hydrolase superfamily [Immersiella caudata]|uniref:non-reducing end alpha-L-arabinofuranosidase n=1 Tax=Immersiella caudata TaxID=314043 RepID=A0AA39U590_9PEZI|nr:glycoside hydrolase superfamily [Immersiella caudata]